MWRLFWTILTLLRAFDFCLAKMFTSNVSNLTMSSFSLSIFTLFAYIMLQLFWHFITIGNITSIKLSFISIWFLRIWALIASMLSIFFFNSRHSSVWAASCWRRRVTESSWRQLRSSLLTSFWCFMAGLATAGVTDCTLALFASRVDFHSRLRSFCSTRNCS